MVVVDAGSYYMGFPDLWYDSSTISKAPFLFLNLTSVFAITAALDFTALGDE